MSILLSDIITGIRDSHPAFDEERVGDGLIARWITQYQRRLFQKALKVNKHIYVASMPISLVPSDDRTPEYSGAGQEAGELPASSASGYDTVDAAELPAGYAVTATPGTVLLAEEFLSSATATTFTKSGAAWVVNTYQNKLVQIIRGLGAGQQRIILSNTADTATVDEWATVPDDTSIYRITEFTLSADTHRVVADFPLTEDRLGYLVKTDAAGTPYIDWTVPIIGKLGVGIPLPQHLVIIGGTCYFDDGETDKLSIVGYQARYRAPADYPAYVSNNELHLVGQLETWEEIAQIELRYVPIPPALTATDSVLLLPDPALPALIAFGALAAAQRCIALGVEVKAVDWLAQQAKDAETDFLDTLLMQRRARFTVIRS